MSFLAVAKESPQRADCYQVRRCVTSPTCANGCANASSAAGRIPKRRRAATPNLLRCSPISMARPRLRSMQRQRNSPNQSRGNLQNSRELPRKQGRDRHCRRTRYPRRDPRAMGALAAVGVAVVVDGGVARLSARDVVHNPQLHHNQRWRLSKPPKRQQRSPLRNRRRCRKLQQRHRSRRKRPGGRWCWPSGYPGRAKVLGLSGTT
jgi:hypothetical protein